MIITKLLLLLLFCYTSFGQNTQYQNLLDTVFMGHSTLFVYSKPISDLQLEAIELWFYSQNLKDYSHQVLDTVMFKQIIQNAKNTDTTIWTDKELPLALLVTEKDRNISKEYAIQKLSLTNNKQIRFYSKKINHFNSTDAYNKNITSFSRPVFDNTRQYAVVQWDNGNGGLSGGGGVILYQFHFDTWKELGIIKSWRH